MRTNPFAYYLLNKRITKIKCVLIFEMFHYIRVSSHGHNKKLKLPGIGKANDLSEYAGALLYRLKPL